MEHCSTENHGFRYTQMYGKARMEMKVGLTFACMNLKKLAKIVHKRSNLDGACSSIFKLVDNLMDIQSVNKRKVALGLVS